jgi:mercuric ion binding protein
MKKLTNILFVALGLMAWGAQAAVQTIKAEINGMVCAFCAQGIDKKLRALPQTKDVYVNLKHKVVAVELKDRQTLSENAVKDLVKDAGYDVTNIQTVEQTLEQIKSSIGKE